MLSMAECITLLFVALGVPAAASPVGVNNDLHAKIRALTAENASRDRRIKDLEEQVHQLLDMFQGTQGKANQPDTLHDQPVRDSSPAPTMSSGSARNPAPSSCPPQLPQVVLASLRSPQPLERVSTKQPSGSSRHSKEEAEPKTDRRWKFLSALSGTWR